MKDFIESHIRERITMLMLAREAGYSPWHSERIFKEVTGKTPFDYVRSLRLSRAAEKLANADVKIVDVAFEFVFDSHEGFTRAFSRYFGMSPRAYMKKKEPSALFFPPKVGEYYRQLTKGEIKVSQKTNSYTVFVQVVDRPKRKFIYLPGKKATGYFEYCEEVGCDIWDVLTAFKDALYEPVGVWMPENLRQPGTSEYCQGVEVAEDYHGPVPEGCRVMELPACKVMIFQGPPYDDDDYQEAIGTFWQEMEKYNPEIYGFRWAPEDGPRFQLAPQGYRGYIEGKPVRQINP